MSFTLANERKFFGVDRKIPNEVESEPYKQGFLFNWFNQSELSNICSENTSSDCEITKACVLETNRKCCYCKNRIVCPERIENGCNNAVLMCDVCYLCCYPDDRFYDQNCGTIQSSGYYIVRNKDKCSNSFGEIIDVVNLESCTTSESEIQSNKFGIQFEGQTSSSDVNEYDEICLDTKNYHESEYKPNVHRMFKNNKIIVVPNTKNNENYYYAEDSF